MRRLIAVTLLVLGALALAPGAVDARPADAAWPGATGLSGVDGDPSLDAASVNAFCTWRGRACGVAHTYTDRTSWTSMTSGSGWVFDNFAGFAGRLVVSQSLVPNGAHGDLAACASGAHDQDWKNFGSLMVRKGRPDTIVRLGWEFNGTFMSWWAENTQTWIDCYRHAALGIRATDPDAVFDWTINAHSTPSKVCGGVSTNCYPGDDVVDIVGIDDYDHYPSAPTKTKFDQIAAAPEGMTWLYAFAAAHGKKFSVGEWGVVPGSAGNTTGENPPFVQWMHDWFAAHAAGMAYEAYFNNCAAGGVQSNLYRPVSATCTRQNTSAGALYQSLFGA
jgi:hypothetical protein